MRLVVFSENEIEHEAVAHVMSRAGLRVVGTSGDVPRFLALVRRELPEVVVLRLQFGRGAPGLSLLRRVCEAAPDAKVMVLSGSHEPRHEELCRRSGAAAYLLLHTTGGAELVNAVATLHGPLPLPPAKAPNPHRVPTPPPGLLVLH